jgi:hypothetical protein
MIRTLRLIWLLPLAFVMSGCASGPNVRSDYDRQVDFAAYRTFGFMNPLGTDKAGYTSLVTERLKVATRLQMEQRGYAYTENQPDLLVNFLVQVKSRTEYVPPPPMPWGPNYYGYRMGGFGPWMGGYGSWPGYGFGPDVIQYTQGVLNIDLIDAKRKQLVWEGIATSVIDSLEQASSETYIAPIVADVFKKYPFLAGSGIPRSPN